MRSFNGERDYSRIIDHPHHQSTTRPHMPMETRAAQFSPFAALTGYDDAVDETARRTIDEVEAETESIVIDDI